MASSLIPAESMKGWSSQKISVWLTKMSRAFREQSALLLQQAQLLERMAMSCEEGDEYSLELIAPHSRENLDENLRRRNVVTHVAESYELMMDTHRKLDNIESRLVPWGEKGKVIKKQKIPKGKSAFLLYYTENFDRFSDLAGTRHPPKVIKEASKAWKKLKPSEKSPYLERGKKSYLESGKKRKNESDDSSSARRLKENSGEGQSDA